MRRTILQIAIVSVMSAGAAVSAGPQRNVLPLLSDNRNWDDRSCFGNSGLQTPNIYRLVRDGVCFDHAFAATASCGPTRAVIYTGLQEDGYIPLFNGRNLDGWKLRRANRRGYVVEDGLLVCPEDGGGYLFTKGQYDDFSLRFEFRLTKGANNGVAIRSPLVDKRPAYEGIEIQILDNVGYPRKLRPTQYHGSIYDVVPAKRGALRPAGQWNEQEIICHGRRITVIVNEMVIVDANLDDIQDPEVLQKHAGLARTRGHVGFLGHASRVEFRRIRIKELAKDGTE